EKIRASACLLRNAPEDFVFENLEFVSNLLSRAYAAGPDCYQNVAFSLTSCTCHETMEGRAGPIPRSVILRDRTCAAMQPFSPGSPQWQFFDSIMKVAEDNIRRKVTRDEGRNG